MWNWVDWQEQQATSGRPENPSTRLPRFVLPNTVRSKPFQPAQDHFMEDEHYLLAQPGLQPLPHELHTLRCHNFWQPVLPSWHEKVSLLTLLWTSQSYNINHSFNIKMHPLSVKLTCYLGLTNYIFWCWFEFCFCRATSLDLVMVMGALYGTTVFLSFNNCGAVQPVVSIERTVFYREKAAGLYSAMPYALGQASKSISVTCTTGSQCRNMFSWLKQHFVSLSLIESLVIGASRSLSRSPTCWYRCSCTYASLIPWLDLNGALPSSSGFSTLSSWASLLSHTMAWWWWLSLRMLLSQPSALHFSTRSSTSSPASWSSNPCVHSPKLFLPLFPPFTPYILCLEAVLWRDAKLPSILSLMFLPGIESICRTFRRGGSGTTGCVPCPGSSAALSTPSSAMSPQRL
jgi:hypothetical protein